MDTNNKYRLELPSDQYVNKLIQWWNDTLFEYGRVMTLDFKEYCDLDSYNSDFGSFWSFELTTDNFKMSIKRDAHHPSSTDVSVNACWHVYTSNHQSLQ